MKCRNSFTITSNLYAASILRTHRPTRSFCMIIIRIIEARENVEESVPISFVPGCSQLGGRATGITENLDLFYTERAWLAALLADKGSK